MTTEIYPIKVIRSVQYNPESYLEFCEESEEEPTQEGFLEFIQDWIYEDFKYGNADETVEYLK